MTDKQQISGQTHFVCLLGNPTGHSLSPAMHNLSFELLGIDSVYLCFDVQNEDLGRIVDAFKAMSSWDGFNVTMPCKHAIIPHLDGLDDAAQLIGAVNVVKKVTGESFGSDAAGGFDEDVSGSAGAGVADGSDADAADGAGEDVPGNASVKALGYNTDGKGFMENLAKHGVQASGARMVLLGPGGAGSAILVQAALDGVSHLDVFARAGGASYEAACELAERVMQKTACKIELHDIVDADDLAACIQAADILVNATPVGMGEGCTETPVPAELIRPGIAVADVIYHPRETQLIRDAKARGCVTVTGLGMLIEQAAVGEAIWYDAQMPIEEVERQLFGE